MKLTLLPLLLPGAYFLKTRINNLKAIVFHSLMEWMPAALIAFLCAETNGILAWAFGLLSFFAAYEIGYFVNDFYSIKFESKPRIRHEGNYGIMRFLIYQNSKNAHSLPSQKKENLMIYLAWFNLGLGWLLFPSMHYFHTHLLGLYFAMAVSILFLASKLQIENVQRR